MNIEIIREYCQGLIAATEDIKWGNDLVFSVGSKMFCVIGLDAPLGFSFKVDDEEFEHLVSQPGIIPAPYMARAKWIRVGEEANMPAKEWKERILHSYELVKAKLTKKLKVELGLY